MEGGYGFLLDLALILLSTKLLGLLTQRFQLPQVVGALLADVVLYLGYDAILHYITERITFVTLLQDTQLMYLIMLVLLVGGTLLGALGSNIAIKKYLKV